MFSHQSVVVMFVSIKNISITDVYNECNVFISKHPSMTFPLKYTQFFTDNCHPS